MSKISSNATWCPLLMEQGMLSSNAVGAAALCQLTAWTLEFLARLSEGRALVWQTAAVFLLITDDRKVQVVAYFLMRIKYYIHWHPERFLYCYFIFKTLFFLFPNRSFNWEALCSKGSSRGSGFGFMIGWNSCFEHRIPSCLYPYKHSSLSAGHVACLLLQLQGNSPLMDKYWHSEQHEGRSAKMTSSFHKIHRESPNE